MRSLPALLLVFIAASAFAQGAYRWVGKDGKVHYSDEAPPPAEVQKIEQKKLNASVISSGGTLNYDTRQAVANFPVTLYTTPDCDSACTDGRNFLKRRGIPFTENVVRTAEETVAFQKAVKSDVLLAPTLMVGSKSQKGYAEGAWGDLLDAAGYPAGK